MTDVPDADAEPSSDLLVLVAFDVVEHEHSRAPSAGSIAASGSTRRSVRAGRTAARTHARPARSARPARRRLAVREDHVDRNPVQPRGERRIAAKLASLRQARTKTRVASSARRRRHASASEWMRGTQRRYRLERPRLSHRPLRRRTTALVAWVRVPVRVVTTSVGWIPVHWMDPDRGLERLPTTLRIIGRARRGQGTVRRWVMGT